MNKHTIYCFVGASGSGKSSLVDLISQMSGMKVLRSYTTRPKRHEEDTDHEYISRTEYFQLENKVATTHFNGEFYCSTVEQIMDSDLYVIDWDGIVKLFNNIHAGKLRNVKVKIIYLNTPVLVRIWRMFKRGDKISKIIERLITDHKTQLSCVNFGRSHADIVLNDRDYKTLFSKSKDFLDIVKIDNPYLMFNTGKSA